MRVFVVDASRDDLERIECARARESTAQCSPRTHARARRRRSRVTRGEGVMAPNASVIDAVRRAAALAKKWIVDLSTLASRLVSDVTRARALERERDDDGPWGGGGEG